jgi:hypothetical protein
MFGICFGETRFERASTLKVTLDRICPLNEKLTRAVAYMSAKLSKSVQGASSDTMSRTMDLSLQYARPGPRVSGADQLQAPYESALVIKLPGIHFDDLYALILRDEYKQGPSAEVHRG